MSYDMHQIDTIRVTCRVCKETHDRTRTHGVRFGPCLGCASKSYRVEPRRTEPNVDVSGNSIDGP